ncbi:hypothetical protein BAE44_0014753 [Dichanthelium oligosanthes]|uniref:Uncharacterized protein n=1 Tax=Dichanthelium oligosanthes TaxID=888268 RepID=A0A1E5VGF8_9POAL|nr:hypothetical protein BAE44_0014753 [Dichanthelium oligosanthes]
MWPSTLSRKVKGTDDMALPEGGMVAIPDLRGDRVGEYFSISLTDSNKGWHSEWFYVANPSLPLSAFTGKPIEKTVKWNWGAVVEEKRMWVELALTTLGPLKEAGLTGIKVLWTLFERRIQPLKARARPLFQYSGVGNPTRVSPEVLEPVEVRSRVWTMIKKKMTVDEVADLDHHEADQALLPAAKWEGYDPPCPLCSRMCYPPMPKDMDRRAANWAKWERQLAQSLERKKLQAARGADHERRAREGTPSEETEVTDDCDDDDDDDDDDKDDIGARIDMLLGLGKHSAEEMLGEPSSKWVRGDPGQGSSGAAPSSGLALAQSGDAPSTTGEAPRDSEATPLRPTQPERLEEMPLAAAQPWRLETQAPPRPCCRPCWPCHRHLRCPLSQG